MSYDLLTSEIREILDDAKEYGDDNQLIATTIVLYLIAQGVME
jgi:hypothetical protein